MSDQSADSSVPKKMSKTERLAAKAAGTYKPRKRGPGKNVQRRYTEEEKIELTERIREVYSECFGVRSQIAKKLGVNKTTVHLLINKDPQLQKLDSEALEMTKDLILEKTNDLMQHKDPKAVKNGLDIMLRMYGRRLGFDESSPGTLPGGVFEKPVININLGNIESTEDKENPHYKAERED